MTTAAERRKHAEKIQKDALQARLDAAQPLIDELSKHETLAEKLAALQTEITDLDTTLGTRYRDALDGGWTTKELAAAGLAVPKNVTRKRTSKSRNSGLTASTKPSSIPTRSNPSRQEITADPEPSGAK